MITASLFKSKYREETASGEIRTDKKFFEVNLFAGKEMDGWQTLNRMYYVNYRLFFWWRRTLYTRG